MEESSRFFQLSYPLVLDILSRLPIHSILQCRCVSKRFLCLISDPQFARLHLSRSPLCILFKRTLLLSLTVPEKLQLSHVDANGEEFQVSNLNLTPRSNLPTCDISDMTACNGLICLVGQKPNESFYVCNPILGEYVKIQQPDSYKDKCSRGVFWGLGYSPLTEQYKILQSYHRALEWEDLMGAATDDVFELAQLGREDERAEIYTIGTGTWRNIGNVPKDFVSLPFNAFLNGVIHWSNISPRGAEFIHSFDFDAEQFGTVPPPDHFLELDKEFCNTITGVLGGCLFIIHFADAMQFDIWVMKEYGVKESWTKHFSIENLSPSGRGLDIYRPMLVLSNENILMLFEDNAIVCYNQKRKQLREFFRANQLLERLVAIAHTPCFVSLYTVAKGEKISRLRSTGLLDMICKEEFQDCTGCGDR